MSHRTIAQSRTNPWIAAPHTGAVAQLVRRLRPRRAPRRPAAPRREQRTDAYLDRNAMSEVFIVTLSGFNQR